MGATPDELEAQISQTRDELSATVEEIGLKVSDLRDSVRPANVVRQPRVQQGLAAIAGLVALMVVVKAWRRHRAS